MKVLKVFEGTVEVVDFELTTRSFFYKGEKLKHEPNSKKTGLLAKRKVSDDNDPEYFYSLNSDYVKENYPKLFTGMRSVDWPKIIDEVFKYNNISQHQLGNMTGISTAYIQWLREGVRKNPSFEMGMAIINLHPNKKELLEI
ncbi:transcriptional regulator [Acinetobacter phage vB_AbaM_fThrA]|nr:hypothetical protein [Acinetobacter phage vB_AbaM_fThrA]